MKLIAFYSVKGGVGVTACAAHVCNGLVELGRRVAAVDLSGAAELDVVLGLAPGPAGIAQARSGVELTFINGVCIGQASTALASAAEKLAFLEAVGGSSEIVVADLSGLDAASAEAVCARADLSVCVLAADSGSIIALPRALDRLAAIPRTRFVINRVDGRSRVNSDALALFQYALGDRILGRVRRDEAVNEACAAFKPLAAYAPASAAARDFAELVEAIERSLSLRITSNSETALEA